MLIYPLNKSNSIQGHKEDIKIENKVVAGLFCLLFSVLLACGTPGKRLAPTTDTAKFLKDDTLHVQLFLRNFYFEPSRIITQVGKPVKFTLKKRSGFMGVIPHDFNLIAPEAGIDVVNQKVPGGDGVTITITPTEVGEFKFFCSKDGHAKKGMVGLLIVKEHL